MTDDVIWKNTICPACGDNFDAMTGIREGENDEPKDGDSTICFTCGAVSIFDSSLRGMMREPTAKEKTEIAADFDIQIALAAWRDNHGRA